MATSRRAFEATGIKVREYNEALAMIEGEDDNLISAFHPTTALVTEMEALREVVVTVHNETDLTNVRDFMVLAFADSWLATREMLRRMVNNEPGARELASAYLALGFGGYEGGTAVDGFLISVTETLNDMEDA